MDDANNIPAPFPPHRTSLPAHHHPPLLNMSRVRDECRRRLVHHDLLSCLMTVQSLLRDFHRHLTLLTSHPCNINCEKGVTLS